MNKTRFGFKNAIRLIFGCVLLFLAVLLGMAGAFLGFVLCAMFLSHIVLLSLIALLFCFLISYNLSRIAWRKILREYRARLALGVGLVTVIGVILISSLTIFKPLVPSSEIVVPRVPEAVDYWDLETGSRIAYLKFPAENKTQEEPAIFLHGGPGGAGGRRRGDRRRADGRPGVRPPGDALRAAGDPGGELPPGADAIVAFRTPEGRRFVLETSVPHRRQVSLSLASLGARGVGLHIQDPPAAYLGWVEGLSTDE